MGILGQDVTRRRFLGRALAVGALSTHSLMTRAGATAPSLQITIRERDGLLRRSFPWTLPVELPTAVLPAEAPVRLLNHKGEEELVQWDVRDRWPDGSVRRADLTLRASVGPLQEQQFQLRLGEAPSPQLNLRRPVRVSQEGGQVTVEYGPVKYIFRLDSFRGIDRVLFGQHEFHATPGPVLTAVTAEGKSLPLESPVRLSILSGGPIMAMLRLEGSHAGIGSDTRLGFYYGKSWIYFEHHLTRDLPPEILTLEAATAFRLPHGSVSSAFGARRHSDDTACNWVVLSDGRLTVDVTANGAWKGADSVRHEVSPEGRLLTRVPAALLPLRLYYHYLDGPPDDVKNTPAATMAAPLQALLEEPAG